MGAYKNNEDLIKINFILKVIVIGLIIYAIISTILVKITSNEYNELYQEATTKISQDDLQIKQLAIENRDLEIEYNELLKDNDENIKQIEWLNEQMVILRGE